MRPANLRVPLLGSNQCAPSVVRSTTMTRWRRTAVLPWLSLLAATIAAGLLAPRHAAADGNEASAAAAAFLSAGGTHTCAVFPSGALKCWGNNTYGQLGQGDQTARGDDPGELGDALPVIPLGNGRAVAAVSAAYEHTCAILDTGAVKCWGAGGNGRLGLGDSDNRGELPGEMGAALPAVDLGTGRIAVEISAGQSHTCAILDDGGVKCWGANSYGQLGLGDTQDRGDGSGEMGDALPVVSLGTGRTAVAISAGNAHTCAILDDGTVKCWGRGTNGRLGQGATAHRGDGPGEMGDALQAVSPGTGRTATAVSAGGQHTCALLDDATVKCWGSGQAGRLGTGAVDSRGDAPGEMGDALPAVPLGSLRTATSVSAGYGHTCVRLDDASVKCFGLNGGGQLGQGSTAAKGDGPNELGDALPPVPLGTGRTAAVVTTGDQHSCARLDDGSVKCFGDNVAGQLGVGDPASRGDQAGEMGDALPAVDLGTGIIPLLRPDLLVRLGTDPWVGDGVYNVSGDGQTLPVTVPVAQSVTLRLRFENEGNQPDDLEVKGVARTPAFKLKYTVGPAGHTINVTDAVVAGTFRFASVDPGDARVIRVTLWVRNTSDPGATDELRFKVVSGTDHRARDVVVVVAHRN